jgi:signal transduction histidine kinase
MSEDPTVARLAPKLVNSITRAVHLCESTLAFGKAEEPSPTLAMVQLNPIVADVVDSERLAIGDSDIHFSVYIPSMMTVRADAEQLYRVISNLVRNARQAIMAINKPGDIIVAASETEEFWLIEVTDTGPGLDSKAEEYLFTPFQGGVRKGGSGLGMAISEELVRGHGGSLELVSTSEKGTVFSIKLPKGDVTLSK